MVTRYLRVALLACGIVWTMVAPVAAQYYGSDINDDLTAAARQALSQSASQSHHAGAPGQGPEVDLRIVFPSEQTGLDNIEMTMLEPRDAGAHQCESIAVKSGGNVISASFIPKKDARPGHVYDVVVSDSMGDLYAVGRIRVGTASQQSYTIQAPLLMPNSPRYTPPSVLPPNPAPAPPARTSSLAPFAQAIQSQAVRAPMLGLRGTTVTPQLLALAGAKTRSFRGVIVAGVDHGSLAERAGLRGGDVIFAVDGRPCASIQQLVAITQDRQGPAKAIDITFLRSNGHDSATVLHAKVPSARLLSAAQALQAAAKPVPQLGLQAVTVTPDLLAIAGAHTQS